MDADFRIIKTDLNKVLLVNSFTYRPCIRII